MKLFKKKVFLMICLASAFAFLCRSECCFADLGSKAQMYYQKGLSLYKAGKYAEAEKEFQKAIDNSKAAKEEYYQKGLKYYEQGEYKKAEIEFRKSLEATEQENDQHYKRGLILYNQGKYAEAEKEFQLAISNIRKNRVPIALQDDMLQPEQTADDSTEIADSSLTYKINVGDVLDVKVWQNEELDDQVVVRPDGFVSFPLVGELKAANKSISQFRQELTEGLREFIKYPQVSVSIDTFGGNRIVILGQVENPGVYTVANGKTILEAIGLAGGFTQDAVAKSVILVKGGLQAPAPQRLDLNKALKKADLSDNNVLHSKDMIYVPRRFIKDVNYFLKAFLDPVASGMFIRREYRDF